MKISHISIMTKTNLDKIIIIILLLLIMTVILNFVKVGTHKVTQSTPKECFLRRARSGREAVFMAYREQQSDRWWAVLVLHSFRSPAV